MSDFRFPFTNHVELQRGTPVGTPLQKLMWGAERKYGSEMQLEHFHLWFERTYGMTASERHPDISLSIVYELYVAEFQAHLVLGVCEVKTKYDGFGDYMLVTINCGA